MNYPTGEAAILTLVQALSAYDSNNSARQNWRQLLSGKSDHYVVLRPGSWTNESIAVGMGSETYRPAWTTVIEVYRRYSTNEAPLSLQGDVMTLVNHFLQYPDLDGAVLKAIVAGGEEMKEREILVNKDNAIMFALWEINIEWQE